VIVGASAEGRAGRLAGVLVSAASLCRPEELAVSILHAGGDGPGESWLTGPVGCCTRPVSTSRLIATPT
jgi:hypothetical protein